MPHGNHDQNFQPRNLSHENTRRHQTRILRNHQTNRTHTKSCQLSRLSRSLPRKNQLNHTPMGQRRTSGAQTQQTLRGKNQPPQNTHSPLHRMHLPVETKHRNHALQKHQTQISSQRQKLHAQNHRRPQKHHQLHTQQRLRLRTKKIRRLLPQLHLRRQKNEHRQQKHHQKNQTMRNATHRR